MEAHLRAKKTSISVENKLKIIAMAEMGNKQTEIAKKFAIKPCTVSKIVKNKDEWKKFGLSDKSREVKKRRPCKNDVVERAILRFIAQARSHRIPVSGPLIQEKAKLYADVVGARDFKVGLIYQFLFSYY